jgi:hypothetical protein
MAVQHRYLFGSNTSQKVFAPAHAAAWIKQHSLCNYYTSVVAFGRFYILLATKYLPTIGAVLKFRLKIFQFLDAAVGSVKERELVLPLLKLTELVENEKQELQTIQKLTVNLQCALLVEFISDFNEDFLDIFPVNQQLCKRATGSVD